jgi:hypothetical protein
VFHVCRVAACAEDGTDDGLRVVIGGGNECACGIVDQSDELDWEILQREETSILSARKNVLVVQMTSHGAEVCSNGERNRNNSLSSL